MTDKETDTAILEADAPATEEAGAEPTEQELWNEMTGNAPTEEPAEAAADEPDAPEVEAPSDEPPAKEEPQAAAPVDDAETEAEPDKEASSDDQEDLQAQNKRLEQQFKSERGRVSSLTRRNQDIQAELSALKAENEALKAAQGSDETRQKLQQARGDFGDIVGPVIDRMDAQAAADARRMEIQQNRINNLERQAESHAQEQQDAFLKEHPDGFKSISDNAAAFYRWVDDQPKAERDIFEQNRQKIVDGAAAAYLVSKFKLHLAPPQEPEPRPADPTTDPRRQRQLRGAQTVKSQGSPVTAAGRLPDDADGQALWDEMSGAKGR